jgi:hypothetical protein
MWLDRYATADGLSGRRVPMCLLHTCRAAPGLINWGPSPFVTLRCDNFGLERGASQNERLRPH